jgi:glutamate N-acetyltransferase/amino-acid N-acetyltransferase
VLPFSTGVIGTRLPVDRIRSGVEMCTAALAGDNWLRAARAIMTTDTLPKGASRRLRIAGRMVTVTGIAKGAGMIRPDMATMLSFIATDARIPKPLLARCLRTAVGQSFNRVTIDGDTSTNDACVLLASGRSGTPALRYGTPDCRRFESALGAVMTELAQAIVRDAEGATKFVAVEVAGGAREADCLLAAYAVAHSPLVKTALFASDPNWGRILAAVGRAGVPRLTPEKLTLDINGVRVVTRGAVDPRYTEERGVAAMAPAEIRIRIGLGMGRARATVWSSDLSHEYVTINAEYRT